MEEWNKVKKELLKNKEAYREYQKLEPKYRLISQIIEARTKKGLTQAALAKKMGTKQSAIARLEAGNTNPTLGFLEKASKALGIRINLSIGQ